MGLVPGSSSIVIVVRWFDRWSLSHPGMDLLLLLTKPEKFP
jgi:hypothetical protein